jgi:hypothetical protein
MACCTRRWFVFSTAHAASLKQVQLLIDIVGKQAKAWLSRH